MSKGVSQKLLLMVVAGMLLFVFLLLILFLLKREGFEMLEEVGKNLRELVDTFLKPITG